jgi:hypothetical protein
MNNKLNIESVKQWLSWQESEVLAIIERVLNREKHRR